MNGRSSVFQLRQRLEEQGVSEVEPRWRQQLDGKVFHRQEERAPPADTEEEDACMN